MHSKNNIFRKKSYVIVTLVLFLGALAAHWVFAWYSYVDEQLQHNQPVTLTGYFTITMRDTMENWQSEFLQLVWQVAGLSFLLYVGSTQSKEGQERIEAKIDWLSNNINPLDYERFSSSLEKEYPKK